MKDITNLLLTISFIAAIVAIVLGYSLTNVAIGCLCVVGLIKAYDLKDLKECGKKAPKSFLIGVWVLYVMFLAAQITVLAWLWVSYPIVMAVMTLAFIGLYAYVMHKNSTVDIAENS